MSNAHFPFRAALIALALAIGASFGAGQAHAQSFQIPDFGSRLNSDEARDRVSKGALRPLRDILSDLEDRFGGRYLRHRLFDGRPPIYEIDWLKQDGGRVTVRVNAESGAVLGVSD